MNVNQKRERERVREIKYIGRDTLWSFNIAIENGDL
jgi:hypothetical protein